MAVMVNNQGSDSESWQRALQVALPDMPVYLYQDVPDPKAIRYAAVWHHPHDDLLRYENLKAVLVLGAGTDHIDQAPVLPKAPIVRLIDPAVGNDMAQYALYWLMHFQRGYETYRRQQSQQHWQRYEYPLVSDYQVCILGAGQIADFIAKRIALNGFNVVVWSRQSREHDDSGIEYYSAQEGLDQALAETRVLINCLPLKPQTESMIDSELLAKLPKGANFINVSRGGVVNEEDLLAMLEKQHIAAAALDTTRIEPLPIDHPFWLHPNLHITPHMSGATYTRTAAQVIVDNIMRMEAGDQPFPIYYPPQLQE